jgi:hypothetical protein
LLASPDALFPVASFVSLKYEGKGFPTSDHLFVAVPELVLFDVLIDPEKRIVPGPEAVERLISYPLFCRSSLEVSELK